MIRRATQFAISTALLLAPVAASAQLLPTCWDRGNCTGCDFIALFVGWAEAMLTFIGPLVVLMFIVGGVFWIVSAGNPERVKRGQQIIIGAVIGTALVIGAWSLVNLTISSLTKNSDLAGEATLFSGVEWSQFCTSSASSGEALQECGAEDDGKACSVSGQCDDSTACVCSGGACSQFCTVQYEGSTTSVATCDTASACSAAGGTVQGTIACPRDLVDENNNPYVCCVVPID